MYEVNVDNYLSKDAKGLMYDHEHCILNNNSCLRLHFGQRKDLEILAQMKPKCECQISPELKSKLLEYYHSHKETEKI
ncbi:MAG: hypothetical protein Harvfovirus78_3 [Harvfovirus sp.]|uniref:Uncharacterized protein n=1 Tax=Harvfovirus sp. TaxID=2487768 RepID=A0A3G5A3X3_9VIRU|nr:MAG: hypothetical protein Harvfovirus78_3 [Harvfovirus sp.]